MTNAPVVAQRSASITQKDYARRAISEHIGMPLKKGVQMKTEENFEMETMRALFQSIKFAFHFNIITERCFERGIKRLLTLSKAKNLIMTYDKTKNDISLEWCKDDD